MRSVLQAEAMSIAQTAVHLDTGGEILRAEAAPFRRGRQLQRAARAKCVTEFPRLIREILGRDHVFADVPSFEGAGQDEFEFKFVDILFASYGVRRKKIRGHIVTFYFPEDFVGAVLVYVLNVKDWIDDVFVLKRPKTVFPAYAGEKSAVAKSGLAIQIKLGGPPSRSAVFQFSPESMKVIAAMLGPERRKVFDLKIAGFFKIVVVGNKIGAFLAPCRERGKQHNQGKYKSKKKRLASDQG